MDCKLCLTLSCFVLVILVVSGAPRFPVRRSSRDLDKIDGLRARLYQLQKQIRDLETDGEGQHTAGADIESESDVSRELHDVSRPLRGGKESQMTSRRQKQVQMLAKDLNEGTQSDLHELAETLNKMLRQTMPERGPGINSAGEYLGDRYNGYTGREHVHGLSELTGAHDNDHGVKRGQPAEESEEEEEEEEDEEEEEEEEDDEEEKERLQSIYKMVVRLYHNLKEEGELPLDQPPERESVHLSDPESETEEGTFGDFVDTEEDSEPSVPLNSKFDMRNSVLSAVEKRLMEDLRDARTVGISVDDLIHDIQSKVLPAAEKGRGEKLREIERELNRLAGRDE